MNDIITESSIDKLRQLIIDLDKIIDMLFDYAYFDPNDVAKFQIIKIKQVKAYTEKELAKRECELMNKWQGKKP